ncbi:WD repeat-containing protein 74 [Sitophilus oryzae]|uniref:WD repeat-containing protein 74 n=1 Tax=Sitophilus oryzae TaxID=7048 RepID=A0A6J2XPH5_SITOR|nr:WD repeat-containing protein 74 [Sitophilus oryzae]XP_030753413.1 WD repeat-containing protein 74 [Sitophilus oryzae]XP_030753415.1 WD repeat-containing protein 74 [Sitophilus oryzae]
MDITKNRFYVATTRGTLLSTGDKPKEIKAWNNDFASEVTAFSNGRNAEELLLGYQNGQASIFSINKCTFSSVGGLEGDGIVTGIGHMGKSIIVSKKDGIVNTWKKKKNDYFSINLDEKGTLDIMVCHPNRENVIGTGGEYNDFKLWDVNTQQSIFKAKSLGHDQLQLPIPTSVRGICYFPEEPYLSACCTKEGHVFLYDEKAQRKPVVKFEEKLASYTCISYSYRDRQIFVGTTKGYMQWLDLRTNKLLKTYTNYTGSVTSIVCDPVEPYVATTSLDRYLRVHHMETKELVFKLYMKQSLAKLIVKAVIKDEEDTERKKEDVVDEEYEDLFKNMEEVQSDKKIKKGKEKTFNIQEGNVETPPKKKRKSSERVEKKKKKIKAKNK